MREQIWRQIRAEVRPGGAILDVGCGAGTDAAWMVEQGWRVVGLDASSGMVAEASRRAPGATIHHPAERVGALKRRALRRRAPQLRRPQRRGPPPGRRGAPSVPRPGARVFLVPMPRVNPAWMAGPSGAGAWGGRCAPAAGRRRPGRGWMGPDHLPERRGGRPGAGALVPPRVRARSRARPAPAGQPPPPGVDAPAGRARRHPRAPPGSAACGRPRAPGLLLPPRVRRRRPPGGGSDAGRVGWRSLGGRSDHRC